MSQSRSILQSVNSAISAVTDRATAAPATAALGAKVKGSTICVVPVGYRVFTNYDTVDKITLHSSHDALYSLHLHSKEFSAATKEGMTDDDRLSHWSREVNAYMEMCGERAAEVTVITEKEAERLINLKSSKWYEAKETGEPYGAI